MYMHIILYCMHSHSSIGVLVFKVSLRMKQIIAAVLVIVSISVEPAFTQITRRYYSIHQKEI